MNEEALLKIAFEASKVAYAPYSRYAVGAALITASGRVFSGCNVENASYGLTVCAERTAIYAAVSCGERDIVAIAVVSPKGASMCGACRQVLREFGEDVTVYLGRPDGWFKTTSISALLPGALSPDQIQAVEEGES